MQLIVRYEVYYDTDNFKRDILDYADDHPITLGLISEFVVERALNSQAVDPAGNISVEIVSPKW